MSEELVLYTHPASRGRITRWMLEELGQPYRTVVLDYETELKAPAYLAINPMGKVPAVTHGDMVITECAAICTYLADAFPMANLAPAFGDKLRAPYYRWLFFAASPLEGAITSQILQAVVPEGRERAVGYGSLAIVMDVLEHAVSKGDYLAGKTFTAADLYMASQLGFGMQFGIVEKRPAFVTYCTHLTARPAYIRAAEIDDALIPK